MKGQKKKKKKSPAKTASSFQTQEDMLFDVEIANLLRAYRRDPEDPSLIYKLARAFNVRNMFHRTMSLCSGLDEEDQENGDLWYEFIIASSIAGKNYLTNLKETTQRIGRKKRKLSWPKRNLGLIYYFLEQDKQAVQKCHDALKADPHDSKAYEILAYLSYTVGDTEAAIEYSHSAIEAEPENFRAHHWLGICHIRKGEIKNAEKALLHSLRLEENYFLALESLGELYLHKDKDVLKAFQCFFKIFSVNPKNWSIHLKLIEYYITKKKYIEAEAACLQLLRLSPEKSVKADAYQFLGVIHYSLKNYEKAEENFDLSIDTDPNFAPPHHFMGLLSEHRNHPEKAEWYYRKALKLDPKYSFPYVRIGYLYFDKKNYQIAEKFFLKALKLDSNEYLANLGMGEIYRIKRNPVEQLKHCERAFQILPEDSNVLNQLGIAYECNKMYNRALDSYSKALEADPFNRQAANNLGYLYEKLMDIEAERREEFKEKAIQAWKLRLLICHKTRSSTRGARTHLLKLGIEEKDINEWLKQDRDS